MKWLEELRAGDKVFVNNRYGERIDRISKVTKTQIVIAPLDRFDRATGRLRGQRARSTKYLTEWTQALEDQFLEDMAMYALSSRLSLMVWDNVPAAKRKKIAEILDEDL
jgi:hypothetical protein